MIQVDKNQEQPKSSSDNLIFVSKDVKKVYKNIKYLDKTSDEVAKKVEDVLATPVEKLEKQGKTIANNFQILASNLTIAASGTYTIDLDCFNVKSSLDQRNIVIQTKATYSATNSTAVLSLTVYEGVGGNDTNYIPNLPIVLGGSSVPNYVTSGSNYGSFLIPVQSSGSPQTCSAQISFVLCLTSRWIRLVWTNLNDSAITFSVLGDI